ncbi:helix-turn-helix transcriptional regulator [Streptomyces sp. NPDC001941]|uniref:helix-turn-helix domain-containing protein n=1 Tax=Streptomyces sp. NPDC001941 TaxID=3154659 RepID=UPI00332E43FD
MNASVDPATLSELTERELEVLGRLASGDPNRVLARQLGIAERTVRAHITSVVRKLGVRSRFEAALVSFQFHESLTEGPLPGEALAGGALEGDATSGEALPGAALPDPA